MKLTFAVLTLGTLALGGVCLVSCVVSPQRPAAQYRVPPQGPDEQAVAQAFEVLVRAYGRQDWDGVMDVFADDAQIESAAPEAAGPSGNAPRILNKREFGQALEPIIASNVGYQCAECPTEDGEPHAGPGQRHHDAAHGGQAVHPSGSPVGVRETW